MESIVTIEDRLDKINFIRYNAVVLGKIEEVNLKFLEGLKIIENEGTEINDKYYERVEELSDLAEKKLCISNSKEFSKTIAFIELSDLMLNRAIKDKDLSCLVAGFYGLKHDLQQLNIFKK